MKLFPASPLIGLLALGYIVYANWLDPGVGRPSLIANAIVIILSLAYYAFVLGARGRWILRDPEEEPNG